MRKWVKVAVVTYWLTITTASAVDLSLPSTSKECWSDLFREIWRTIAKDTYLLQVVVVGMLLIGLTWAWRRKGS